MNSSEISEPVGPAGEVRRFWNTEACGSHYVQAAKGTPEFYEQYRRFRYRVEWHIPQLVPFSETRGKKVLEIGCGNGADGTLFAQQGALYTGVDLTEAAVASARRHFEVLDLPGEFQIENAERLTFPDGSFDFVYSYGVLHHSPDPAKAFAEIYRVLKPGGKAVLMVYHKHSFNYYVRILGYMRGRVVGRILSRMGRLASDRARVKSQFRGLRGNEDSSVWQVHYENFLRTGWNYLAANNFVHHATDGPECPFAFVYTRKSFRDALSAFSNVQTRVAHLPLRKYPTMRWVPLGIENRLASWMGWYLFAYMTK
jgi:SAM-dependent methyltransferase